MKDENIWIGAAAIIVFFMLLSFFNFSGMRYSTYGMMGWFGGMWFFGWLFMILATVALILFIVWLIKQIQGDRK